MLDKLIISKNNTEGNKTLKGLLFSTSVFVTSFLMIALVFSLFSQNLALGQDDLNITTLIAPPVIPESVPPEPEPVQPKESRAKPSTTKIATRRENIQRSEESPVKPPDKISTKPTTRKARPNHIFEINPKVPETESIGPSKTPRACKSNCGGGISKRLPKTGGTTKIKPAKKRTKIKPPPVLKKTPKKTILRTSRVLNGKAKSLVKPRYPAPARTLRVSGQVIVQVTIDERGNVISASAVKGHPLLRSSAAKAARSSKFTPTFLGDSPVKVSGLIIYNFKP